MKYKVTQSFYICPRGYVHITKPSYHFKRNDWDSEYTRSKEDIVSNPAYFLSHYKYTGPKSTNEGLYEKEKNHIYQVYASEEVYLEVIRGSTYRPLYKQKRPKKENGVIYMYTIPKTFSVENKYKQFRL